MPRAGDDDVTDRNSFDPGVETGYLRRATRDHPPDPDLGAAPFDPGTAGYDDRRARKTAKRRSREERERREAELREREEEKRRQAAVFARAPSRPAGGAAAAAASALEPEPVEIEPQPPAESEPAPVTELRGLRPAKPLLAERLERERAERAEAERERRAQVESGRQEREREENEKRERRRREREERLRRDREALRERRPQRGRSRGRPEAKPVRTRTRPDRARSAAHPVRVTRPHPLRHRELVWPTAKAGIAVTIVLSVAAALGSLVGLPVPGLNPNAGNNSALSASDIFGVDAGTPQGLAGGYVFPIGVPPPYNYGEGPAKFGAARSGHIHEGQDVFARPGTPLMAVRDGVVVDGGGGKSFYGYGGGNSFVLYSPTDDRSYVYLHMLHPSRLHAGDQVHAGQQIGQMGCTGSCDGTHLHFEIREGKVAYGHEGKPINPLPFLREWELLGTQG